MQDDFYLKEINIIDKTDREKEIELMNSIAKAREDLERAHRNFEFAEDDLIDYYTYQIKANQSKLDYLTRLAKYKKIKFDIDINKAV